VAGITKQQLKDAQSLWDEAEVPEQQEFDDIPDGKYRAELVDGGMESREWNDEKHLQVSLQWKIVGPTHEGRRAFQNIGLDTKKGAEIAKGTFSVLGQTLPKKVDKIGELIEEMKGTVAEINLRHGKKSKTTGKSYQNVYVNKLVTDEDGETTETEEEETQDLSELELVGQNVSFEYKGEEVVAEVTEQTEEELTVEDGDGEVYTVAYDEVTLVEDEETEEEETEEEEEEEETEEEEEAAEIEVGSQVQFEVDEETVTGEVRSIEDDVAKVKRDDTGKLRKVSLEDLELVADEEEEEEEEAEEEEAEETEGEAEEDVEYIGKAVSFKADGKKHTGKVVADDNDGNITVIDDAGEEWTMEYGDVTVTGDAEEAEEGTEEEEVEEKPKAGKKKMAKKKTAKKTAKKKKTASSGRAKTTKKTGAKAKKKAKKKTRRV